MQARRGYFRYPIYALLLFVVILLLLEAGLRISDSYSREQGAISGAESSSPYIRSWYYHHAHLPSQSALKLGGEESAGFEITTNSLGLRGHEVQVPKPPRVFRVICLGDEQILGGRLPIEQTFCALLQQQLQSRTHLKVEVINAGIPDFCPLLSYLQFRHSLAALQPDVIIQHFEMGDVADDYRFRRHTVLDEMGVPVACPHEEWISPPASLAGEKPSPFLLVRRLQKMSGKLLSSEGTPGDDEDIGVPAGRYAWLKEKPPEWDQYVEDALSPMGHAHQLSQGLYARFLVAVIPAPWQVSPNACSAEVRKHYGIAPSTMYQSDLPFEKLEQFTGSRQMPLFNPLSRFRDHAQSAELYSQSHPELSRSGHQLYAEELARYLIEKVPGIWTSPTTPAN